VTNIRAKLREVMMIFPSAEKIKQKKYWPMLTEGWRSYEIELKLHESSWSFLRQHCLSNSPIEAWSTKLWVICFPPRCSQNRIETRIFHAQSQIRDIFPQQILVQTKNSLRGRWKAVSTFSPGELC
jgi:hypothetical protein